MLPRPLLLAGCFIMAMFAGWTVREAQTKHADTQQAAAASSAALTMPAGLDDDAARMWLADHLTDATSEQLKDIAHQLLSVPDLTYRAWSGLFACWFEKDPAAAWAFAATREDPRTQALQEWAALDPAAARAALTNASSHDWLLLIEGASRKDMAATFRFTDQALAAGADLKNLRFDRDDVVFAGILDFASQDPDATATWADKLEISPNDIQGVLLLGRWKKDPAAAKEWLSQQTDRSSALIDLGRFARAVAFYQPSLTDFIADGFPAGNERIDVIEDLLKGLAWRDPDFAGKEATRVIPDQAIRANIIGNIASLLADADFDKAWSLLQTLDPSLQRSTRGSIPDVELLVGTDSGAADAPSNYQSHFIGPDSSLSQEKSFLLYRLMQSDKEEAIRVMEGVPAGNFINVAGSAFLVWENREPEQAVRWLAGKLGTGGSYSELSNSSFQIEKTLDKFTPEQKGDLIESLPPGTVRTVLVTQRGAELMQNDPLAGLQFVREQDTAEYPVTRVYELWAYDDPPAALKHLLEDPDAPISAWEKVTTLAYRGFPEQAMEAILTLPGESGRDAAIQTILESMGDFDPSKSSALAFAISDANKRDQAIEAILTKVSMDLHLAADPATADALKQHLEEATNIPEAERHHWLERINSECPAP